jgi:hypothetical protein
MTPDELAQKTSKGETYAELQRRARADWEPPQALDMRSPRWVKENDPDSLDVEVESNDKEQQK